MFILTCPSFLSGASKRLLFVRGPLDPKKMLAGLKRRGGVQRWMTTYGNVNEGSAVPIVNLEQIKFLISDLEHATASPLSSVSDVLSLAGFGSIIPVAHNVIPRFKMQLPRGPWAEHNESINEFDALVQGSWSSVSALTTICNIHCINDDQLLAQTPFKILVVDEKSSVATLLSKIGEDEKAAGMIIAPNEVEPNGHSEEQSPPYWILQSVAEPAHKVVFISGGQRSKNFILRGDVSSNDEERKAWHMLREAKVSLFYKQPSMQQWITEISNAVQIQAANAKLQSAMIDLQKLELEYVIGKNAQQAAALEKNDVTITGLRHLVRLIDGKKKE
jgi:hypothetical protein